MRQIISLHRTMAASSTEFSVPTVVKNSKGKKITIRIILPQELFPFHCLNKKAVSNAINVRLGFFFFFFNVYPHVHVVEGDE